MDVFEAYLECLKEKGQVDVKVSYVVEFSNRVDREGHPLTVQMAGYALKRYHLMKKKSHGTMVIVYDAELLRKAIAQREQEATWCDRMQAAMGEGSATAGNPPPEGDETVDSPPSVLSTPEVPASVSTDLGPDDRLSPAETSELQSFPTDRAAAVLSASPASLDQVCEACGRPRRILRSSSASEVGCSARRTSGLWPERRPRLLNRQRKEELLAKLNRQRSLESLSVLLLIALGWASVHRPDLVFISAGFLVSLHAKTLDSRMLEIQVRDDRQTRLSFLPIIFARIRIQFPLERQHNLG